MRISGKDSRKGMIDQENEEKSVDPSEKTENGGIEDICQEITSFQVLWTPRRGDEGVFFRIPVWDEGANL